MEMAWEKTSTNFKAMIIGKLLGDGCITKQKGRRPRFQFTHMHSDYEWSNYCYGNLKSEIPLNSPKFKKTIDSRLIDGFSLAYYVQSKTSDVISYLRSEWYRPKTKIIPFELLTAYFNDATLAWWYMDDGHFKQQANIPRKIILSTESFTTKENSWLINFLHQKYNLQFKLDKQNRIILYDQFQIHYFLHLVTPHMHHSMHRKVLLECPLMQVAKPRRTTIYLPKSIVINSPTKDINSILNDLDTLLNDFKLGVFYQKQFYFDAGDIQGYQIVISEQNLAKLTFLKLHTGLTFSQLSEACFKSIKQ